MTRLFFVTFLLKSQNCAFVQVRVYLSSVTYLLKIKLILLPYICILYRRILMIIIITRLLSGISFICGPSSIICARADQKSCYCPINFVAFYQGAGASLQTKTRKHKLHISALLLGFLHYTLLMTVPRVSAIKRVDCKKGNES